MDKFQWILAFLGLREVDLTVRAQTIDPDNVDGVIYPAFLRANPVTSMKVMDITEREYRQVAFRRPWDADGTQFVQIPGPQRDASFTPIEIYDFIGEEEIYQLFNLFGEESDATRRLVAQRLLKSIPTRVMEMSKAVERRMNIEAANAWAYGTYSITEPKDKSVVATVSFGYEAERYETALTAWDDPGVNAVEENIAWLRYARMKVGPLGGQRLSTKLLNILLADAPVTVNTGYKMSQTDLQSYIGDRAGVPEFRFVIDDYTYETSPGTHVRYWPEDIVAAIPRDRYVGTANFAPVVKAAQLASQVPNSGVRMDRKAVEYSSHNEGKALKYAVQMNAYPWLNEQRLAVMNTGI